MKACQLRTKMLRWLSGVKAQQNSLGFFWGRKVASSRQQASSSLVCSLSVTPASSCLCLNFKEWWRFSTTYFQCFVNFNFCTWLVLMVKVPWDFVAASMVEVLSMETNWDQNGGIRGPDRCDRSQLSSAEPDMVFLLQTGDKTSTNQLQWTALTLGEQRTGLGKKTNYKSKVCVKSRATCCSSPFKSFIRMFYSCCFGTETITAGQTSTIL